MYCPRVTPIKAPRQYNACWRRRVTQCSYADCETALAPSLSQAYLLFLGRGASSHALFDAVACLPVCVCVAVFQFLKRVHAYASSHALFHGVACLPASHCGCVAKSSSNNWGEPERAPQLLVSSLLPLRACVRVYVRTYHFNLVLNRSTPKYIAGSRGVLWCCSGINHSTCSTCIP